MDLIKNKTLITELDKYHVNREIYNSICDQMNWPVDEVKVQYRAIRNLLRFTKFGRRWAYDTPVLKQKITVPGFMPTMLGFEVYLTKGHVSQYVTGLYELTETMLLSRLSPYFKRFIDVGANVGYFSFLMAGAGKEVIAFEPTTETYGYLTKGIEKNNLKITAHKYAVGEKRDKQDLYLTEGTGQNSLCNVTENKETVEVVPLDEFAGPDTLIKIDVENYEEYALRGMKNWIESADRPIILIESWPPYDKKVIPLLQKYYKVFSVNPKPRHGALPLFPVGHKGENFLALPRDCEVFDPIDMRIFTPTEKLENLLYFVQNWK